MAVTFVATYTESTRGSATHSFIYSQNTNDAGGVGGYSLVDIVGVTLTGVESTVSDTDARVLLT